ncbi:MAG: hypothetical protein GOVbin3661_62 [Prokaryotic dsDNA virus sp.]|nr:MAG: hypothetical protein GOVbin3661_62 [Prokaryotic dsDNA virus sp.]|tara:strand:+ start:22536 stop:24026 length:1491 start_codon:yes stop_codon:yes gene_type:complete
MAQLLPLQRYEAVDYNGLVTDNHFHALYQQKPELISSVIREIYKTNLQGKLREFVNRFPVKEVEQENGFYNWMLQGQHDKNLPLVDAETIAGNAISANIGANGERFNLIFGDSIFDEGDVLKGETDEYHLLVKKVSDAGSLTKVEVELVADNPTKSVPPEELAEGTRWSKFYSLSPSTLSYQGSSPYFTSPWRMENRPSTLRMEYKVPGNVINKGKNEPLEFGFQYKGQSESIWINYQDMVAHHQCEEMFSRMLMYGKKNWTNDHKYLNKDDKTKYSIESGAGFFEQVAPSNVHYYNSYDIDWHLEMLLDMGVGKIERGRRTIHLLTGEFGAIEISKQIQAKTSALVQIVSDKFITGNSKAGNIGGKNTKSSMEPQYNIYEWYNGVVIKVEILDFFDDDVYFPKVHPDGKGIVESHRILALDYGEEAGIYRVKPKGVPDYNWAYIPGMRDPFSPAGKGSPKLVASPIDGYEVHMQKWGGMMIEDPTKVVDLRLSVD